jgi:hypothetical protein
MTFAIVNVLPGGDACSVWKARPSFNRDDLSIASGAGRLEGLKVRRDCWEM